MKIRSSYCSEDNVFWIDYKPWWSPFWFESDHYIDEDRILNCVLDAENANRMQFLTKIIDMFSEKKNDEQ